MRRISIGLLLTILAGCSTDYQPSGLTGGYEEAQLAPNVWRVTFGGNGYTSQERTQDFATLRSAELTLKNGYRYFGFAAASVRSDMGGTVAMPSYSTTTGSAARYGNTISGSSSTVTYPGAVDAWTYPTATNTVVMFRDRPPGGGMIYDAQFVCGSLGAKYKVKCG